MSVFMMSVFIVDNMCLKLFFLHQVDAMVKFLLDHNTLLPNQVENDEISIASIGDLPKEPRFPVVCNTATYVNHSLYLIISTRV